MWSLVCHTKPEEKYILLFISALTKIFVTAGMVSNHKGMSRNSELIDLNGECTTTALPDYPLGVLGATGLYIDGKIVICGGSYINSKSWLNESSHHYKPLRKIPNEKRCYQLEKGNKAFKLAYTMKEKRVFAKSIVDQGIMLLSGGSNNRWWGFDTIGTGEYINNEVGNNTAPRSDIKLPEPITNHAFIKLNQSTSMLIGGVKSALIPVSPTTPRKTYFFNSNTNEWSRGPNLKYGRAVHSAGTLIDHVNNNQHIAVVGGWVLGWEHPGTTDSVELLLYGDNVWTQGTFFLFVWLILKNQKCFFIWHRSTYAQDPYVA